MFEMNPSDKRSLINDGDTNEGGKISTTTELSIQSESNASEKVSESGDCQIGSTQVEEEEILLTLTGNDLFADEFSSNVEVNQKVKKKPKRITPPDEDEPIRVTKVSSKNSPNSTSSDSKIIELNHVEEDPDEHVDDSGSEKTLDSSSIARQIKLMNLDYAKLTLLQKIDQLSEEIQEGPISLEISTLFSWVTQLNDILCKREQSSGNAQRGVIHQLIDAKLILMKNLFGERINDIKTVREKLVEIKNLYKEEETIISSVDKGLLFEKKNVPEETPKATASVVWQASLYRKEILHLKNIIEKEEVKFYKNTKFARQNLHRTSLNPNKKLIDQHFDAKTNTWESQHYKSWRSASFEPKPVSKRYYQGESYEGSSSRKGANPHQSTSSRGYQYSDYSPDKRVRLSNNLSQESYKKYRSSGHIDSRYSSVPEDERQKEKNFIQTLCMCCGSNSHQDLILCPKFFQLEIDERWRVVRKSRGLACEICLQNHDRLSCLKSTMCSTKGCRENTHSLLHRCSSAGLAPKFVREDSRRICVCCNNGTHTLDVCYEFLNLGKEDRYCFVRSLQIELCKGCLEYGHTTDTCNSRRSCNFSKYCRSFNHPLIHRCDIDSAASLRGEYQNSKHGEQKVRAEDQTNSLSLKSFFKFKLRERMEDPSLCDDMMAAWLSQSLDESDLARMVEKFKPTSFEELKSTMLKSLERGPFFPRSKSITLDDVAFDTADYYYYRRWSSS